MKPSAVSMVRAAPHYRADAIRDGLRAAGFNVVSHIARPGPGDAVVVWNRYAEYENEAQRFERAGAAVLVIENGYLGNHYNNFAKPYAASSKPFDPDAQLYALALNEHNGAGRWWIGDPGRWRHQGIEVKPWRTDGEHVLVLAARGIGPPSVAQPRGWPQQAAERLRTMTKRPVRIRAHPGNVPALKPLEADLEGAWCAVTWGSGAALKSVCAGVPVFSDWPRWIGSAAASSIAAGMERPLMCDASRIAMLDRLAWAQHTVAELSTGEPFRRLLDA